MTDAQRLNLVFDPGEIRVQQAFGGRGRIAEVVPGGLHRSRDVAAEGIGRLAADIDHHKVCAAQVLLQRDGIDQKRMDHGSPCIR